MEFPADVSTNCYTLQGSSDVAYAICVPAKTSNTNVSVAENAPSGKHPPRGTKLLRDVESELRRANILVAVDEARGELFTFYRKEDLQRDAKSIFSRVVTILRRNECQMSSKNALKTAELLHPERAKLYRLFMSAMLSMIMSCIETHDDLVLLGPAAFLSRTYSVSNQADGSQPSSFQDTWRLHHLYTQLLPNGQVVAMSSPVASTVLNQFSSLSAKKEGELSLRKPRKLLLAPIGQYVRYNGGHVGKLPIQSGVGQELEAGSHQKQSTMERRRQERWKGLIVQWLTENKCNLILDCDWIEVEMPFHEVDDNSPSEEVAHETKVVWKSFFWPASLCFVYIGDEVSRPKFDPAEPVEDPLKFVEDWVASAADRGAALRKLELEAEMRLQPHHMEEHDLSHGGSFHVDAAHAFRRVTSLDGQAAAMIYPTPPDGALSHVTPGVFSVDGLAATPGEGAAPLQVLNTDGNIEMVDAMQASGGIGTGLYDEDLFDDVPGEKFGEAEMADEPNWDFFDEPDVEVEENADDMDLDMPEQTAIVDTQDLSGRGERDELANDEAAGVATEPDPAGESPDADKIRGLGNVQQGAERDLARHGDDFQDPESVETMRPRPNSPPLSPIEVRKKLLPDVKGTAALPLKHINKTSTRRSSLLGNLLEPSPFQPQLKTIDSRYSANGLFWFESRETKEVAASAPAQQLSKVPLVGVPKKEQDGGAPQNLTGSPYPSSDEESEFNSSDFFSEGGRHNAVGRLSRDGTDSDAGSLKPEDEEPDLEAEKEVEEELGQLLDLLHSSMKDVPFSRYHLPLRKPSRTTLPITLDNLGTVAQVIADQASQSSYQSDIIGNQSCGSDVACVDISGQLKSTYGEAGGLDLSKLAELAITPEDANGTSQVVELASPYIRLGRADSNIDALSSIQPFWETLGLQPVSGKKGVTALCIHPAGAHTREASSAFLQRISETYSSAQLGDHVNGTIPGVTKDGLVDWKPQQGARMQKLLEVCENLGSSLTTLSTSTEIVVVYVVNPIEDGDGFVDICTAFVALFLSYAKGCGKSRRHELVLQIIPMDFIASSDTFVIPSQVEYLNLTLEVYNRCPPTNSSGGTAEAGAAVRLAVPMPKNIVFGLQVDTLSPLATECNVLHLAYSASVDHRWITASWTDTFGGTAFTIPYCLRRKGSRTSRSRSEIIKEMWEISGDIMIKARGEWRLFVAHDGPLEPDEINEWSFLANQGAPNSTTRQCMLSLVTFDTNPSIQFSVAPSPAPQFKTQPPGSAAATTPAAAAAATMTATAMAAGGGGRYGTPVSTPLATPGMIPSPEQFTASPPIPQTPGASSSLLMTAAPTPPDQTTINQVQHGVDLATDPDATLVDPSEDCWSLVLSFGLNNSSSCLDSRPALVSGFLLKRAGLLDTDGLVHLGVNLIYTRESTAAATAAAKAQQKALLRELLSQWRGLYTLARTKGLVSRGSVLPWHVRTAVVGCKAVADLP